MRDDRSACERTSKERAARGGRASLAGLGLESIDVRRKLRAANLGRLAERSPEAQFVRSTIADVNAAMLSINHALGFRPYFATTHWQLPVDGARASLSGALATSS